MPEHRSERRFLDRRDAGRLLAKHLGQVVPAGAPPGLLVLGLPRGGVVVAAELAAGLPAELDVLIVRKVAHPSRPELALGAVTAIATYRNDALLERVGVTDADFDLLAAVQVEEVRRRERTFRAGRPTLGLAGRAVLVVDDGLATGATAMAAVRAARAQRPLWLGFAAPVGSAAACAAVVSEVDVLTCPLVPRDFGSVSRFYRHFPQTSDREVQDLLAAAWGARG